LFAVGLSNAFILRLLLFWIASCMWCFILVAVNVLKASAVVWLWSWIRIILCAALNELVWDVVVCCLQGGRGE
jgi:hypothetical protein